MEVINKNPSAQEDKAFSEFLKTQKAKERSRNAKRSASVRSVASHRKQTK